MILISVQHGCKAFDREPSKNRYSKITLMGKPVIFFKEAETYSK